MGIPLFDSATPLEPFLIERFENEVLPDEKFLREFDARKLGQGLCPSTPSKAEPLKSVT